MLRSAVSVASLFITGHGANHDVTWVVAMTTNCMRVETGDTVTFTWTVNHNVYSVANHAVWTACTLTDATELSTTSPYEWTAADTSGHVICQVGGHCAAGQKMMIMVGTDCASDTTPTPSPTPSPMCKGWCKNKDANPWCGAGNRCTWNKCEGCTNCDGC